MFLLTFNKLFFIYVRINIYIYQTTFVLCGYLFLKYRIFRFRSIFNQTLCGIRRKSVNNLLLRRKFNNNRKIYNAINVILVLLALETELKIINFDFVYWIQIISNYRFTPLSRVSLTCDFSFYVISPFSVSPLITYAFFQYRLYIRL